MTRRLYDREARDLDDSLVAHRLRKRALRRHFDESHPDDTQGLAEAIAREVEGHREDVERIERRYLWRRRLYGWVPV